MKNHRCKRCNRPLKNEKSIKRGLGYICYRKVRTEQARKEFERIQTTIYEFLKER